MISSDLGRVLTLIFIKTTIVWHCFIFVNGKTNIFHCLQTEKNILSLVSCVTIINIIVYCLFQIVTMAIRPLVKRTCVKKRTKKFIRHQSDRYLRVKVCIIVCLIINYRNTPYLEPFQQKFSLLGSTYQTIWQRQP